MNNKCDESQIMVDKMNKFLDRILDKDKNKEEI